MDDSLLMNIMCCLGDLNYECRRIKRRQPLRAQPTFKARPIEERFEHGKQNTGLDENEPRFWHACGLKGTLSCISRWWLFCFPKPHGQRLRTNARGDKRGAVGRER